MGRSAQRLGVGAVLLALLASLTALLVSPAAQAYPESVCAYAVQPQDLVGGKPITVTGTSTVSHNWRFRLDANANPEARVSPRAARTAAGAAFTPQEATGTGTTFSHSFTTPTVTKKTTLYVHCFCDGGGEKIFPVTLEPTGSSIGPGQGTNPPDHNGILPGTGGPALWVLLAAVALLLVGLGISSIRRGDQHDPWATS
jgi:hypothetical protein